MSSKTMQVLLREDIQHLGHCGDVVKVAAGYARNYLLPRRLAESASEENIRAIARRRERFAAERAARLAEHAAFHAALDGKAFEVTERCDPGGRLFGSVNAAKIAVLITEGGHPIEADRVRLAAPIKEAGDHSVVVHVFGELDATVTVTVHGDGLVDPADEPEEEDEPVSDERDFEVPEEAGQGF